MARDYRKLVSDNTVVLPRWVVLLAGALLLIGVGLRILVPPSWMVQRLDSPDGHIAAQLLRTQYLKQHLKVHVREGWLWRSLFHSEPLVQDYRIDLGERLHWSPDSRKLYLEVSGRRVWGYDFVERRRLSAAELKSP